MEVIGWLAIFTIVILALNNMQLRKELKEKIDFDYEEYLIYRKSKD